MRCRDRARPSRGSGAPASTPASRHSGMLTKKIQRQVRHSVKTPPRVGPTTADMRPDAGQVALRLRPLGEGVDVAGDGDAHRLHRARAQPLQRAEHDERRHAPGEPAQDRAEQEQRDAEQHDRLATERCRRACRRSAPTPPAPAGRPRTATGTAAKPPRSATIDGTAVATMVESRATSEVANISEARIGPRSDRRPTAPTDVVTAHLPQHPHATNLTQANLLPATGVGQWTCSPVCSAANAS